MCVAVTSAECFSLHRSTTGAPPLHFPLRRGKDRCSFKEKNKTYNLFHLSSHFSKTTAEHVWLSVYKDRSEMQEEEEKMVAPTLKSVGGLCLGAACLGFGAREVQL